MAADPLATTTLRQRTRLAVANERLRDSLATAVDRFATNRVDRLAEFGNADELRRAARASRADVLARLPELLEQFADNVIRGGGHVCWATTAADATDYIIGVAQRTGARTVVKSKSMAAEEIHLNEALEAAGAKVVETDLGEWIIQLARERPSHIIAPAVHRDRYQVYDLFERLNDSNELTPLPEDLAAFARQRLRAEFLAADLGISGVNFGVAEAGAVVLVTNEGNGRMVTSLPRVHVAVMGMERVVASWEQLDLLLNLLVASATGQVLSSYTSIIRGPRRRGEADGPDEFHLVILDNGRREILGSELHEILACIRCGACLNVCPVYRQVGGHAYGGVYPGPIGAVLTPLLESGAAGADEVPNASSLCAACMDACPVGIPIQDLLLALRRRKATTASASGRAGWRAWAAVWSRPRLYRASIKVGAWARPLSRAGAYLPGGRQWTVGRSLPRPARHSFLEQWQQGIADE
ncbi:MAG: LutB/LldF family L-lactate oxidation iron-sulfur protein [Acidimicrobiales bacterium]